MGNHGRAVFKSQMSKKKKKKKKSTRMACSRPEHWTTGNLMDLKNNNNNNKRGEFEISGLVFWSTQSPEYWALHGSVGSVDAPEKGIINRLFS